VVLLCPAEERQLLQRAAAPDRHPVSSAGARGCCQQQCSTRRQQSQLEEHFSGVHVSQNKIEAAQNDSSWLLDASPPSLLRQSLIQTSQFAAPHCLTPGLPAVPQYCCTSISALSPTEHDQHKRHIQPRQRAVFPPFFLQALSSALLKATSTSQQQQQWLPDRSALQSSGLLASGCIPEGVESALLQAVPGGAGGLLLVLAERPR
jgi:hypothetical protein